jgi:phosphohistidine phosphatase
VTPAAARQSPPPARDRGVSLYLVRHAIAEPRGSDWPDDTKRPLTHRGMARMREAVRGLDAAGVEIPVVLTSPLVRARQTAELLAQGLSCGPSVEVTNALLPGQPAARVAEALASHARAHAVALVGHEPGLGEIAAWLLGTREPLPFKKGGVCRIDVTGLPPVPPGQLVWFALPKMLRALGQ